MEQKEKIYINAEDMANLLGISKSMAYKIIKSLNAELTKMGYLVVNGKLPRRYFEKRWYGYDN